MNQRGSGARNSAQNGADSRRGVVASAGTGLRWAPGWRMTLFVLVFLPLLLSLGNWQLSRAAEKDALEAQMLARSGELPQPPAALGFGGADGIAAVPNRESWAFRRARVEGRYLPDRYYRIDNQVREGAVGFGIFHLFEAVSGQQWWVNRGFIAAPDRQQVPGVDTPPLPLTLVATLWPDTGLVPLLAPEPEGDPWPRTRQRVDWAAMAQEVPEAVPVELRLEAGQPGVLNPAPLSFPGGGDRHRGYAVQWFALAAVLIAGYVIFALRAGRRGRAGEDRERQFL